MVELEIKNRLCFPFCQDLGNKKVYRALKGLDDKINIKWSLFRVKQHDFLLGSGGVKLPNSDIIVPGNYSVERVKGDWTSVWGDPEYTTFIAPDNYYWDGKIFFNDRREFTIDLPKEIEENPHLHKHSTFLFSYLKNDMLSSSCQFLNVENGKIKIEILISASPSGTYLIWNSGVMSFKWKIEVRQDIVVMNLVKEHLKDMWNVSKKIGKGVLKFATYGAVDLTNDNSKDLIEKMTEEAGGKDHWKKMGLDKEKIRRNQEKQMERTISSTLINEATLEPPILASETVHLPYNLFDYGLRAVFKPHWEYRIYVSENLLNNIIHNNNENPITYPLNITFKSLAGILKKGYWQGRLKLDYDPGGFMAEKFAKGVTFFEDKEKDLINPNLNIKSLVDQMGLTGFAGEYYQAEEIRENEEYTNIIDRSKGANYHQRAHYFITYEDGTNEHWLVKFPRSFKDSDLVEGHSYGGFNLQFDKPVKEFIDVYTCIGCGAKNQGYTVLHADYDSESNDSLETIHKGLPYEPWFSEFTRATLQGGKYLCPNGKCLGGKADVWEFTGQYIRGKDDKPFTEAYGWIPSGGTIRWRTKGGGSRVLLQKVPGHNDFDNLDWTPSLGSGGEIEIPLTEPDLSGIDPTNPDIVPETDFIPDLDPTGGEPEITPLEPDLTQDPDFLVDPDFPEPEIPEPALPEPEPSPTDPDTTPDTGDRDPGVGDGERPEDFD